MNIPQRDAGLGLAARGYGDRPPRGLRAGEQGHPGERLLGRRPGPQTRRLQWGRTAGESPSRLDLAKPSPKGIVGALGAPRTPAPHQNASLARRTRPVPAPRTRAVASYLRSPPPRPRGHRRGRGVRSGGGVQRRGNVKSGFRMAGRLDQRERPLRHRVGGGGVGDGSNWRERDRG